MRNSYLCAFLIGAPWVATVAGTGPQMLDPKLAVRTWASEIVTPTTMAFLGDGDLLVLEKNTGKVLRFVDGELHSTVLDLGVNFASERGLLGIALHPDFPDDPGVYLFWTCRTDAPPEDPFVPDVARCSDDDMFASDTDDVLRVPLLGNRVDRFEWNTGQGSDDEGDDEDDDEMSDGGTVVDGEPGTLTFDKNLIMLLAFQNDGAPTPPNQGDEEQPPRGNHDGGLLAFGPDGKLYILVGDLGRRGQLQNLPSGPTETGGGTPVPDDQFGGPRPDDEHLSGVILRLTDDGKTPHDNPFYAIGAGIGGEVGRNIQKIYAYGIRNSFGMAFDPRFGHLWVQENGEDAFDELNRFPRGANSGWIQIQGPDERVPQYKEIETTSLHGESFPNLQQLRWGPERIADTPQQARARLFALFGSQFVDPELSWRHVIAPAAIGFVEGWRLGGEHRGDLFMGLSVPFPLGGPLLRINLSANGRHVASGDPRLADRVADNLTFNDLTESESLVIGRDFGIVTDIETGPDGHLYVVSLSNGAIYEIYRK